MLLENFRPRSKLVAKTTFVKKPKLPVMTRAIISVTVSAGERQIATNSSSI
jgi:hypothetical protein